MKLKKAEILKYLKFSSILIEILYYYYLNLGSKIIIKKFKDKESINFRNMYNNYQPYSNLKLEAYGPKV